jgi:predicted KAP-like P-loop ATPase
MNSTFKFNPDRPITSASQDVLGREKFIKIFADSIKEWKGKKDSLVIGLTGPWGCGKSSIKNLLLEQLSNDKFVQSIEFNPWEWSNSRQVGNAFFQELGKIFKRKDFSGQSAELAVKWQYYSELANLVPLKAGNVFSSLFGSASKAHKARQEYYQKELSEVKSELAKDLSNIDKTIFVIIDDIDRLLPEELKIIVQLIKSNADFPNIVYLLLLDKEVVGKNLEKLVSEKGSDYLEKIIQVEIPVPISSRKDILSILDINVGSLFQRYNKNFDKDSKMDRWQLIFFNGFQYFFNNLRDLYRFHNRLSFTLPHYVKEKHLEINIIDLMLILSLDVFEPKVFNAIQSYKDLLLSKPDSKDEKVNKEILNQILKTSSNQEAIKEIISDLFPNMKTLLGTGYGYADSFSDTWRNERRICHPDWFDVYFELSLPEKIILTSEKQKIQDILNKGTYIDNLSLLKSFYESDRFELFIDFMESIQDNIIENNIPPLLPAIFTIGDGITNEGSMFNLSLFDRLGVYTWRLFENKIDINIRGKLFLDAMKESTGISIPVIILRRSLDKKYNGFWGNVDVSEQKAICVNRIKTMMLDGKIWNVPCAGHMLIYMSEWGNVDDIKEIRNYISNNSMNSTLFLSAMLERTKTHAIGTATEKTEYSMTIKNIERFIKIEELNKIIENIDTSKLQGENKIAIDTYKKAIERKGKGLPDDTWYHDLDNE